MKSCETLLYNFLTARDLSSEGLEGCVVEVGALLTDSEERRVRDWWMDPLRMPSFSCATDTFGLDLGNFESASIWP